MNPNLPIQQPEVQASIALANIQETKNRVDLIRQAEQLGELHIVEAMPGACAVDIRWRIHKTCQVAIQGEGQTIEEAITTAIRHTKIWQHFERMVSTLVPIEKETLP